MIHLYDMSLSKLKIAFKEAKENVSATISQKYKKLTLDEWFEDWKYSDGDFQYRSGSFIR